MDSIARSGVGVLDKSVEILSALAERGPLGLAELVGATGLTRPTAHRLAAALAEHGLVGRDPEGRFRLGLRLLAWGARGVDELAIVSVARPVLTELRDAADESAQLYVRDDLRRVCVATAERRQGLRDAVPVGAALPLDRGSGGRALLAHAPDADRFPRVEPVELAAVRRRGWAATVAEREPGVASVSAPVRDPSGQAVAAVSLSGSAARFGSRRVPRLGRLVADAARELERRAGWA